MSYSYNVTMSKEETILALNKFYAYFCGDIENKHNIPDWEKEKLLITIKNAKGHLLTNDKSI